MTARRGLGSQLRPPNESGIEFCGKQGRDGKLWTSPVSSSQVTVDPLISLCHKPDDCARGSVSEECGDGGGYAPAGRMAGGAGRERRSGIGRAVFVVGGDVDWCLVPPAEGGGGPAQLVEG